MEFNSGFKGLNYT